MELLKKDYAPELEILNVTLPKTDKIPFVKFSEAKELVAEKYNRKIRNPFDLEPGEEELIGGISKRNTTQISFLSLIIPPRSARSTRWMTRQIPVIP